jgi:M6 family metalloprotease-like protein
MKRHENMKYHPRRRVCSTRQLLKHLCIATKTTYWLRGAFYFVLPISSILAGHLVAKSIVTRGSSTTQSEFTREKSFHQQERAKNPLYIRQLSPSTGNNIRALVLLVQFPEHDRNITPLPTRDYFDTLCNTQIVPYLQKQSYGRYNIAACDVQEWKITDYSQEFYSSSASNLVGSEFASEFFIPVLHQLDDLGRNMTAQDGINRGIMDWTIYDTDYDGKLDAVIALHSGYGAEYRNIGNCNASNYIHRIHSQGHDDSSGDWYDEKVDDYQPWANHDSSVALSGYAIASVYDFICTVKPATPGVITHEWIHVFGAPDLYGSISTNTSAAEDENDSEFGMMGEGLKVRGLGSYDIMSNARGPLIDGMPASLSVYTKYSIGWMSPVEILYDGIYTLAPSHMDPTNAFMIRHPQFNFNEYILIEFRTPSEYDIDLFGGGLLMYHVDDSQRVQGGSTLPYGNSESHLKVAVIQADGKYDIELGVNNGDEGDFWKAGMKLDPSGVNSTKDALFYPSTDSYFNGPTGLSIYIMSISDTTGVNMPNNITYVTIQISGLGKSDNDNNSSIALSPISHLPTPSAYPTKAPNNTESYSPSRLSASNVPSDIPSFSQPPISSNAPYTNNSTAIVPSIMQSTQLAPDGNIGRNHSNNNGVPITSGSYSPWKTSNHSNIRIYIAVLETFTGLIWFVH